MMIDSQRIVRLLSVHGQLCSPVGGLGRSFCFWPPRPTRPAAAARPAGVSFAARRSLMLELRPN